MKTTNAAPEGFPVTLGAWIERLLGRLNAEGRDRLFEHEAYALLTEAGGPTPPRHRFVRTGEAVDAAWLGGLIGDRVVLKVVSREITHKSDAGGVVFCERAASAVERAFADLVERLGPGRVEGMLVVEMSPPDQTGLGGELFIGLRSTREFGPVLAAGLGGTDAEFLAASMKPDRAIARAPALLVDGAGFLAEFRRTAAYDLVAGRARGRGRSLDDGVLERVFRAFLAIARAGMTGGAAGLVEFEINPLAVRGGGLTPLDGRGRVGPLPSARPPRPAEQTARLLEPRTVAVLGVSATNAASFGRIILRNVLESGFAPERVRVIKPGPAEAIDGVACVASVEALPWRADLLVVAAGAGELPGIIDACVESGKVGGAILIPGGAGETEGSGDLGREIASSIARARAGEEGPVFLGPNCLGVLSRPGRYDTLFIPAEKLDKRRGSPHRGVALVSQSGAFVVSRMSRVETLDPALAVSLGNQADLTLSDMTEASATRADIHAIGIYAEGFVDLDGLALARAVRAAREAGKVVVFYKAGRTEAGRDAAAGHTASLAGDQAVCDAALRSAGALLAADFEDFTGMLEVAGAVRGARGVRIGAIANAGCETVAMADAADGSALAPRLASLGEASVGRLRAVLAGHGLGSLVNARNPLDLTPMAGEGAYEDAARVLLESEEVDAVLVSCIPLTPAIASTEREMGAGFAFAASVGRLSRESGKPVVAVVDAGARYEAFVGALRGEGVAVLRSADRAVRAFAAVLAARAETEFD